MIVPIKDSVGAALRFARENVQLILIVAALAALGQGVIALLGVSLIWIVAVLAAMLVAHTAFVSRALGAPAPITQGLAANAGRLAGTMAMIGFFLVLVFFVVTFFAMTAVISPYQQQIQAAGEDQVAVQAIMQTAIDNGGNILQGAVWAGALVMFAVTTRFYVAAPATIGLQRITVFESWRMTRGNFLRIAGARILLLAPAFILAGALQTLIARLLGTPVNDVMAVLAYSQANAVGFALFYTFSMFFQIALVTALDAGLSASIYRRLSTAKPPSPAV